MFRRIADRLGQVERTARRNFPSDLATPGNRRRARLHTHLFDHAFLRTFWTNFHEIAPGVFRSNQPSRAQWHRMARRGIRTLLNLRGASRQPVHLFALEVTEALGFTRHDLAMSARHAPPRAALAELFAIFDRIERPFVIHCKSGADRTGLAAALWLLDQEGADMAAARAQLSLRYLHRRDTRTGVLDSFLDAFEAETGGPPASIRDWVATRYDPDRLQADFDAWLRGPRRAPRPYRPS